MFPSVSMSHKPCLIRSCKICGKGVPMVFSLSMQARLFDNVTWECYGEFKPRVYTTSKHWQCSVQASIGTCQKLISHVEKIYSGPCGIPQLCCFPYRMRLKGFHPLRYASPSSQQPLNAGKRVTTTLHLQQVNCASTLHIISGCIGRWCKEFFNASSTGNSFQVVTFCESLGIR